MDKTDEDDDFCNSVHPVEVITRPLKLHAPGLRQTIFLYGSSTDDPYEYEYGQHCSDGVSWRGGRSEEEVIYDVLKRWAEELPSLEYVCFNEFSGRDPTVKKGLQELNREIDVNASTKTLGKLGV